MVATFVGLPSTPWSAMSIAGPDEVCVSSTTSDLLEGSGLSLEPAGTHEMKGLSGSWKVFRLVAPNQMAPARHEDNEPLVGTTVARPNRLDQRDIHWDTSDPNQPFHKPY